VAGKAPVRRNWFIRLSGGINRSTGSWGPQPGIWRPEGYISKLAAGPDGTPVTVEFVIGAYDRLFQIEKSFRISQHGG
jgi:hypothetical protein